MSSDQLSPPRAAERLRSRCVWPRGLAGGRRTLRARVQAALDAASAIPVIGVHFHLDGYDAGERVAAIRESLGLIDALRPRPRPASSTSAAASPSAISSPPRNGEAFWEAHRRAPLTFEGHPLANVYPYHQAPVGGDGSVRCSRRSHARSPAAASSVRCEPGRSMVDGCGMTVARVRYRKRRGDGPGWSASR